MKRNNVGEPLSENRFTKEMYVEYTDVWIAQQAELDFQAKLAGQLCNETTPVGNSQVYKSETKFGGCS